MSTARKNATRKRKANAKMLRDANKRIIEISKDDKDPMKGFCKDLKIRNISSVGNVFGYMKKEREKIKEKEEKELANV